MKNNTPLTIWRRTACTIAAACILVPCAVQAQLSTNTITISNSSFESPITADYTSVGQFAGTNALSSRGWTGIIGANTYVVSNGGLVSYTSGVAGNQALFLEPWADETPMVWQNTGVGFAEGTYTLTVNVGMGNGFAASLEDATAEFQLVSYDGTYNYAVGTPATTVLARDYFGYLNTFTFTLNLTGNESFIGDEIAVVLKANRNTSTFQNVSYDNVRLAHVAGPGTYWAPVTGGGGTGTWASSNANWATAADRFGTLAQAPSSTLVFAGTNGTVTVSGAVTASNGLTFSNTGYVLTNGTVNLGGLSTASNTVTTASDVQTTIHSVLAGSNGLAKAGSGTLVLAGSNAYTGSTEVIAGSLVLAASNALPSQTVLTTSGGSVDLAGTRSTVGGLSGSSGSVFSSLTTNSVVVSNFSFETPVTANAIGVGQFAGANSLANYGWNIDGANTYLVRNGGGSATYSSGVDGNQALFFEPFADGNVMVWQNLGESFAAGTYNLSVNVGMGLGFADYGELATAEFQLLAYNGSTYNYDLGVAATSVLVKDYSGYLNTFTFTLNLTGNESFIGDEIAIVLRGFQNGSTFQNVSYDNIRLAHATSGGLNIDVASGENYVYSGTLGSTNASLAGFSVTKSGAGTQVLAGNNNYSGGTTLAAGTLALGSATGAGTGRITQTSGSSLLEIATGGTVANAMSLYNIRTLQTVTLSGNKTLNNATYTVDAGTVTTESGVLSGSGGLAKQGTGTLTLTANNSFSGTTAVDVGVLNLNSSTGSSLGATTNVTVAATLLISQSNQVNNSAAVTLSGGTIRRGGDVSEVFGDLNVSAPSFLDFGAANAAGSLSFGAYTESALLTVQNFLPGNKLQFASGFNSALLPTGGSLSNENFSFSNGFTTGDEDGYFTITAIPEPSTILAALGLAGLMLWPACRRSITPRRTGFWSRRPS